MPIQSGSRLFSPFRALGFVSNDVPLDLQVRGPEHFVTTAIGNSFHVYSCSKLKLAFVGQPLPEPITFLLTVKRLTLACAGHVITLFNRGKKVRAYTEHSADVRFALSLGEHVISVDDQNHVKVWELESLETYLAFNLDMNTFRISTAVHPSTYLNKILFASQQGSMQLRNIRTDSLIHTFEGWKEPISVLEQAPAVDVVAVGLQNGDIILHNLKFDESIMKFNQDFGPVTSITFRTDGEPVMATGSTAGHVSFWNLEKRVVANVLRGAHAGGISSMNFLTKEPLMISSAPDNSLKIWIFDNSDGSGRLLRSRGGHSGPPTKLLFYGPSGQMLLSSGLDRALRYLLTIRDEQSCEISQGSLLKKSKAQCISMEELRLPPILDISAEPARDRDWDSVVTCHLECECPQTWQLSRKAIGKHKLGSGLKYQDKRMAKVVDVSSCGNFAAVGYSTGHASLFNMQSGIHRGDYPSSGGRAHTGCLRGIAIDNANLLVITSSADATIKFWKFKDKTCQETRKCDCPITKMKLHRESSLLCVAFDDFTIKIIDIDTRKTVREFPGHSNIITDIAFSNDSRWLVSAGMDGAIKTWDIPAARLVDCFVTECPVTSLALSPTSEFLATTHVDNLGIYLWSNNVLYTGLYPSPLPNDYEPSTISLPTTQTEADDEDDQGEEELSETTADGEEENLRNYKSPEQLSEELVTLSLLPESRWRNLTNLELIKERNKPKEPPKKQKAAPFFLPTIAGLEPTFDLTKETDSNKESMNSKLLTSSVFDMDTEFQSLLKRGRKTESYMAVLEKLRTLSPAQTDVELRTLAPDCGGSVLLLECALDMFRYALTSGRDYELTQAHIALFLKLQGNVITSTPELRASAQKLLEIVEETWAKCNELIDQSTCLVNYFKSATV